MIRILACLALLVGLAAVIAVPAPVFAQEKAQPFALPNAPGQQAKQSAAPTAAPSAIDRAWAWLMSEQSRMHREMAAAVKDLKTGDPVRATGLLMLIAFLYGVLHAAGPGHGKAVISSYVLTNEETVRRGIALSFLAALFQALSAIVFVGIFAIAFNRTSLEMRATENLLETLSWGLVALLGLVMLYRQFRSTWAQTAALGHRHQHDHDHADGHDHVHGPDCGCGHSHMPAPKDLEGAWSWRKAIPLAFSVGVRPCTGALLLLIFALSQGLWWAGVLGTFAMAFGTALTVSVLAALAVSSRDLAERLSGEGSLWASRIHAAAGFTGAALVFLLGAAFFLASLKSAGPL